MCMARVNVYLPDELASRVKKADLNVSAIAQKALEQELAGQATNAWLAEIRRLPPSGVSHDEVIAALDAARDEYDPR
jgi:post-segregation antitoxin (ccd killing protein)